jgi:hypothetical protein
MGILTAEPFGLSAAVRAAFPPGLDGDVLAGMLQEDLAFVNRFAAGASAGWAETDPELIRNRGRASAGLVVGHVFPAAFAEFPAVAERVAAADGRFLDVGLGAAGIAVEMCRRYPSLSVVGLDVSAAMLAVARTDVAAAGFADRVEVRDQSVADLADVSTFDLMWLPQPFIPRAALSAGLSRLAKAARPDGLLVMPITTNERTGFHRHAEEVAALMSGGGSLTVESATALLHHSGFTAVSSLRMQTLTVMLASVG